VTHPTTILLATGNPAKQDKLRWLLQGLPLTTIPLSDDIALPPVEETGAGFTDNAVSKAVEYSRRFGGLAISSDGGIEIPALGNGWQALLTGRAAGPDADDAAKARHLLALMRGKAGDQRRVSWTEAVALAEGGKMLASWQESGNQGRLTESYDPAHAIPGFWVYSLWFYPRLGKRYVELTPQELAAADLTWGKLKERVQEWFMANKESGRP